MARKMGKNNIFQEDIWGNVHSRNRINSGSSRENLGLKI